MFKWVPGTLKDIVFQQPLKPSLEQCFQRAFIWLLWSWKQRYTMYCYVTTLEVDDWKEARKSGFLLSGLAWHTAVSHACKIRQEIGSALLSNTCSCVCQLRTLIHWLLVWQSSIRLFVALWSSSWRLHYAPFLKSDVIWRWCFFFFDSSNLADVATFTCEFFCFLFSRFSLDL